MTLPLDSFLVSLAQGYNVPDAKVDQSAIVQATIQAVKARPIKVEVPKPRPTLTFAVQPKGSLTALEFIQAMHDAGMRWSKEGKPFHDPSQQRDDQIKAIAAFTGYDPADHFGSQELRARMKANSEIYPSPVVDSRIVLIAKPVQGMPDPLGKQRANLEGRERLAVDSIAEHELAASEATSGEDRDYHLSFVLLERERLAQIRQDLQALLSYGLTQRPFETLQAN